MQEIDPFLLEVFLFGLLFVGIFIVLALFWLLIKLIISNIQDTTSATKNHSIANSGTSTFKRINNDPSNPFDPLMIASNMMGDSIQRSCGDTTGANLGGGLDNNPYTSI
jgi:methyl-accepting chemotaxis protein